MVRPLREIRDVMATALRVLFVAPSETWFEPIAAELERGGYAVTPCHAASLEAACHTLQAAEFELVLCGPGPLLAVTLARWLHRLEIDVPLIVIGHAAPAMAKEVMQAGAHDFIPLTELERLSLSVARELREMAVHRERGRALVALRESEARFRQLTDAVDECFWLADCGGENLIYASPACERLWGRPPEILFRDISGFLATVHPEDVPQVEDSLAAGGCGPSGEYRIQRPDGEVRWVRSRSFPVRDRGGRVYRSASVSSDITAARQMEAQMRTLSRALEQTADCVLITDGEGVITYVNAAFEDITGYSKAEVLGRKPSLLCSGFQDTAFYRQMWQVLLSGLPFCDVFINRRKDGELYYEEKTITPLRDEQGNITHFVATGKDITRRLLAQQRLHRVLHYDALTGLANRILFVDRLGQALLQARRLGLAVGVLHVGFDLAGLFGEALGRETTEGFQGILARHLKEVVVEGDTVARLGRDEFAILHKHPRQTPAMEAMARRIMLEFAQPMRLAGYELFVTPAIGISLYPGDDEDTEELLRKAEIAMRQARERGEHYHFYHPDQASGVPHVNG